MIISQEVEVSGLNTHVCRLKKVLCGLKKALSAWYSMIYEYLLKLLCFTTIVMEPNLYNLYYDYDLIFLVIYVDDLFLIDSFEKLIAWYKKLESEYALLFGSLGLVGCKWRHYWARKVDNGDNEEILDAPKPWPFLWCRVWSYCPE